MNAELNVERPKMLAADCRCRMKRVNPAPERSCFRVNHHATRPRETPGRDRFSDGKHIVSHCLQPSQCLFRESVVGNQTTRAYIDSRRAYGLLNTYPIINQVRRDLDH